jgi:hypothetical protein
MSDIVWNSCCSDEPDEIVSVALIDFEPQERVPQVALT